MHCSQKTFHFLNVCNCPTSFWWNISVTLRKSNETILWDIFEKSQILARHVFETFQRRHEKDIFLEICSRRLKDVIQKTFFLRCLWDVLKTSQKSRLFCDISERSLRCLSVEIWLRSLRDISYQLGCRVMSVYWSKIQDIKKSAVNIIEYFSYSKNGIAQCVNTQKIFQRV